MTRVGKIQQNLANFKPSPDPGPRMIAGSVDGSTYTISAEVVDTVGARVSEISVRRNQVPEGSTMESWAKSLADQVSGLGDKLRVLEIDPTENKALLRSETPRVTGNTTNYYEVVVEGTSNASVRRYQGSKADATPRQHVPFAITHESLATVVDELAK